MVSTAVRQGGLRKARHLAVGKFHTVLGSRGVRVQGVQLTASWSWEDDILSLT